MKCDSKALLTSLFLSLAPCHTTQAMDYNGTLLTGPRGNITISPNTPSALLASYTQSINTAGLLDQTFGSLGFALITVPAANAPATYAGALQPDGKILLGGTNNPNAAGATQFLLSRCNPNGSIDTSFNGGAMVTGTSTAGAGPAAIIRAIVLQPDGKIVTAGPTTSNRNGNTGLNTDSEFCLQRFNPNGSIDITFNTGNPVVTNATNTAYSLLLQPNGNLIAVGNNDNGGAVFTLVRYLPSGAPDPAFNGGVSLQTPGTGTAYAALLQPDGKIIAIGNNGTPNFRLIRYTTNGIIDPSFGSAGAGNIVTTAGTGTAYGAALQADGKIIAVGESGAIGTPFCIVRYNTDGSIDQTFNGGTPVITANTHTAQGVVVQPDGKIVVVGGGLQDRTATPSIAVRYNSDGTIDTSFGPQGTNIVNLGANTQGSHAVLLQPDDRIIVLGDNNANLYLIAARLINPFTLASFSASYGNVGLL